MYFAFLLLTLLVVTDAKAQNYSSESYANTTCTSQSVGIWCKAQQSSADIYTEEYVDDWDYDYSKYGNLPHEVVHSDGTHDYINYNTNAGSTYDNTNQTIAGSSGSYGYSTVNDDFASYVTWSTGLEEVVVTGSAPLYYYCSYCGLKLTKSEWLTHNCLSSLSQTGSINDNLLPEGAGGGSNGNSNNVYDDIEDKSPYSSDLQTILESVKIMSKKIKELIEKFQEEGRFKEYEVEVDANGNKKKTNCYYDPADGCIHVPIGEGYNVDAITHELIHYLQEQNIQEIMIDGKLEERSQLDYDRCSADCEYQDYVMNFILNRIFNNSEMNLSEPQGTKDTQAWENFKEILPHEITFNKNKSEYQYTQKFIDELNNLDHQSLSEPFRSYYEAIDNYYESKGQERKQENYYRHHDENYKYDWEKLFIELGFTKK